MSLPVGIPSWGREIGFVSSSYPAFCQSEHTVRHGLHPCFEVGRDDRAASAWFPLFAGTLDFGGSELIKMCVRHDCQTSYLSSLFFTFLVVHFSGKKKVTQNITDDCFPNWQGVIWHFKGSQFGPWPQDSLLRQCWSDPRRWKIYSLVKRSCK